jgi:hypothetical protein
VFDEVLMGGWGGIVLIATGRQTGFDTLLRNLRARGIDMQPGSLPHMPALSGSHIYQLSDADTGVQMFVVPSHTAGAIEVLGPGITYFCATGAATDKDTAAAGLPTLNEVRQIVETQQPMPGEWVDNLIVSNSQQRLGQLVRYLHLNEKQVDALLVHGISGLRIDFIQ